MLRNQIYGIAVAGLTFYLVSLGGISQSRAHGWSYHTVDRALDKLKRYVDQQVTHIRYSNTEQDGEHGVLLMKLGMGIPYCKDHAAGIAVRDGKLFRKIAVARTLRGVTASTIGLTAARLSPGTYYIVQGYCHVGRRAYSVGQRSRLAGAHSGGHGEKTGGHGAKRRLFKTAYAKFTIEKGQALNAGFLRFFPPQRRGGRLKIRLQTVPRQDLRFIAARYPRLRERLTSRLMRRTTAAGHLFGRKRIRKAAPTVSKKPRKQRRAAVPATARPPLIRSPARASQSGVKKKSARKSSMTPDQRRAACIALLQLKKEGKVRKVPVSCGKFRKREEARSASGLPPAIGPDK